MNDAKADGRDETQLIGVDWGTTHLRAYRLGEDGAVLAARSSSEGMGSLRPEAFAPTLAKLLGDWWRAGIDIVCCGMVGARQGWMEAPYCPAPAGVRDLALAAVSTGGERPCRIIPGVCVSEQGHLIDVMRGEEVKAIGAAHDGLILSPGTHAKWIEVEGGRIARFRTYMTGELYGLLANHSVLRHSVGGPAQASAAFLDGVGRALAGEALTASLFSIRVASLDDRQTPQEGSARLSGLLIGAEIAAARQDYGPRPITLVGVPEMTDLYTAALKLAGFEAVEALDAQAATTRGLWRVWKEMQ
jgi:2-dehydro-3-deoxygalactonokinase